MTDLAGLSIHIDVCRNPQDRTDRPYDYRLLLVAPADELATILDAFKPAPK